MKFFGILSTCCIYLHSCVARDTHLELSLCFVNPSQPVPYTSLFLRYLFKPVLLKLDGSKPMLESFIYLSGNKLHWNGGTYFRVILPRIVHQCSNTWEQADDEQFPPSWKLPPSTIGGNHHQSPPSPSQSWSVLQLVFNKECVLCLVWKVCPGSPVVENSFSCFEAYWDISPAVDAPSSEQQSVQVCVSELGPQIKTCYARGRGSDTDLPLTRSWLCAV